MGNLRKRTLFSFMIFASSLLLSACISTGINGPDDKRRYEVYIACGGIFMAMFVKAKNNGDAELADAALTAAGDLNYALKVKFPTLAKKGINAMAQEKDRIFKLSGKEYRKYIDDNLDYCIDVVKSTR